MKKLALCISISVVLALLLVFIIVKPVSGQEAYEEKSLQRNIVPTEYGWAVSDGMNGSETAHDYPLNVGSGNIPVHNSYNDELPISGILYFDTWDAARDYIPYPIISPVLDTDVTIAVQGGNTFLVEGVYEVDSCKTFVTDYTFFRNKNWNYAKKYNGEPISKTSYTNANGYEFYVVKIKMSIDGGLHTFYTIAFDDMLCELEFSGFSEQEELDIVDQYYF